MKIRLINSVILSGVADHDVNGYAVEGPRACVPHHGHRTEFSLEPDLEALR